MDFLSSPEGSGSALSMSEERNVGRWLPAAIVDALGEYRLRDGREKEGGAQCLVLERPRREVFWFDPTKGYALRRRDSFDPVTGRIKERTTLDDFSEVAGVWLPRRLVQEEFGGPDDPKTVVGEPRSRKTIQVVEISTDPIPDDAFRIAAPIGVTVHDPGSKSFYTRYRSGENPIVVSAELARGNSPPPAAPPGSRSAGPPARLSSLRPSPWPSPGFDDPG